MTRDIFLVIAIVTMLTYGQAWGIASYFKQGRLGVVMAVFGAFWSTAGLVTVAVAL